MIGTEGLFRGGTGAWHGRARVAICLLAAGMTLALIGAGSARAGGVEDFSGEAFQILAPGAEGGIAPGPFSSDQAVLYNDLTAHGKKISRGMLKKFYLSEKFHEPGQAGDKLEPTSRAGLEIWRDSHDIPHIFGATRGDVMYGSGWVAAQDRGLLLKLGLGPAYVAALSVPGLNAFELLLNGRSFTPSAQATSWVEEQKNVLIDEKGAEGEQVIKDLEEWTEGVNGYEQTLPESQRLPHVTLSNAIAGFAFIGSIFGNGGGSEVANSNFLANLQAKYGEAEGLKIFRDLREVNDPEAPTTASKAVPVRRRADGSHARRARRRPRLGQPVRRQSDGRHEGVAAQGVELPARRCRQNQDRASGRGDGPAARLLLPGDRDAGRAARAGHRSRGSHRTDLAVRVHRPRTRLRVEPDERRQREHPAVPAEAVQPRRRPGHPRKRILRIQRRSACR